MKKFLFVCLANLCRSPMAMAIARHLHPGEIEAASAGVSPSSGRMVPEALDVIARRTGQDLSGHVPRFVLDYPVRDFDFIIALDSSVFLRLAEMPGIPRERLYGWEIADPCGSGVETYESAARAIENELTNFIDRFDRERREASRRA